MKMDTKHDVRLSKQTGGGASSMLSSKLDTGGQDHQSTTQVDCKTVSENAQKKPYFLLNNFRPLKQGTSTKVSELTNPQVNGPQIFKKTNFDQEENVEDTNGFGPSQGVVVHKNLANSQSTFKLDSTLDRKVCCRVCQQKVEFSRKTENVCAACFSQHAPEQRAIHEDGLLEKQHIRKASTFREADEVEPNFKPEAVHDKTTGEKLALKSNGFSLYNNDRAKQLINAKKDPKALAMKIDQLQVRKPKGLCSNETSNALKNLSSTAVSNIKISFVSAIGDKKLASGKFVQSRNSPKTPSVSSTLQNQGRTTPESLEAQGQESKPDSKKSIKPPANPESQSEHLVCLHNNQFANKIIPPRKADSLLDTNFVTDSRAHRTNNDSHSSSSAEHLKDKHSHSSNGKSDEQLCKAFSVDRSLTMTIKLSSVKVSESIETDPEMERSMRYEEQRTLSFLNEDDEILDKVHEQPQSTIRKNRLKMTSGNFLVTKKYSACEEKTVPANSLINVISNPQFQYYTNPAYVNMSANLSHNEASMFSTQDSRPGQNKSLNYDQMRQTCEPISDSKHNSAINYVPSLRPFPSISSYGVYPTDLDPRFMREKISHLPTEIAPGGFERLQENFALSQFEINQNLSMVSVPSAEDDQQKKNRARKSHPVTDTKEFGINVDRIFDIRKTTLMIKNIPNRYTKEMMLETIDKKFKERYNFFYLPIDFDNNCNVGYAFINFVDLNFIREFFLDFNGTHWPNFKSDKICEITYARIQGKEACIQHFKDSSLMKQEVS